MLEKNKKGNEIDFVILRPTWHIWAGNHCVSLLSNFPFLIQETDVDYQTGRLPVQYYLAKVQELNKASFFDMTA